MTQLRQSRSLRRAGVRLKLTARDERLLRALARFGIARTPDLVRVAFGGTRADTAAARLRRLFDGGYVEVRAGDRSKANVYTLGPRGRAWCREAGITVARVPHGDLEHHLAIVRVWTVMSRVCHDHGSLRLVRFVPDWEIRLRKDFTFLVVPDALVEMAAGGRRVVFALEVDRGGERALEWRRKLQRYGNSVGTGLTGRDTPGLVVLFEGGARRQKLLEEIVWTWAGWTLVAHLSAAENLPWRVLTAFSAHSPDAPPLREGEEEQPKS